MDQYPPTGWSDTSKIALAVALTLIIGISGTYLAVSSLKESKVNSRLTSVSTDTNATKYNCVESGGMYGNGNCTCDSEMTYDAETGYCMTSFGIPGGSQGEVEKKLQEYTMMQNEKNEIILLDSTKETQSFSNSALGISFNYPESLTTPTVETTNKEENPDVILYDKESKTYWDELHKEEFRGDGGPERVTIDIYDNTEKLSLEEWLIKNSENLPYTNYSQESASDYLSIDGKKAIKYSVEGLGEGLDYVAVADTSMQKIVLIRADHSIESDLWYILHSFKFTK